MNRIVLVIILLFGSCKSDDKAEKSDLKGLDAIRYKMAKVYKEGKVERDYELKTYSFKPCIPCDIDFLLRLEQKKNISEEDMENLLCIDKGCENNAEFRQLYNEILIKSFNKNPSLFSQKSNGLTKSKYQRIILELQNPVNDRIEASEEKLNSYLINRIM